MTIARSLLVAALALALPAPGAAPPTASGRFEFGLIGDLPYNPIETKLFRQMLEAMDAEPLAFVVHDGDIKGGGSACSDSVLEGRRDLLDRSAHPLVLLFGDNEWTDCHRTSAGAHDPLERLAKLRALFATGSESLGRRRMPLERQSGAYPENVRWRHGAVHFVGLHVVGSHDNRGRIPRMDREHEARRAAVLEWLRSSFARAREERADAIVVLMQADPRFEQPAGHASRRAFESLIAALAAETLAWNRPVVVVHGDSHRYRVDHPLRDPSTGLPIARFTRVGTFGSPHVRWVRATYDPAAPERFTFEPGPDRPAPARR